MIDRAEHKPHNELDAYRRAAAAFIALGAAWAKLHNVLVKRGEGQGASTMEVARAA